MNGTSGFQEVRSSTSRSPSYRLLYDQRHQFGKGFWHLFHPHDLIALSIGISTKQEKVPDTFFQTDLRPQHKERTMPIVTNPANGTTKNDSTFDWNMQAVFYTSSKVIVGHAAGADDIYVGSEQAKPTLQDAQVQHPHDNSVCFTRVKYRKQAGGAWYTTGSTITSFTSI